LSPSKTNLFKYFDFDTLHQTPDNFYTYQALFEQMILMNQISYV